MKHYEVSSVYESLNLQWDYNLINQNNAGISCDFCKGKFHQNSHRALNMSSKDRIAYCSNNACHVLVAMTRGFVASRVRELTGIG